MTTDTTFKKLKRMKTKNIVNDVDTMLKYLKLKEQLNNKKQQK